MLDLSEIHIWLRRVIVYHSTCPHSRGKVAEVVELAGNAVDNQRIAGGRIAAVNCDGLQPAGSATRRPAWIVEADSVVAAPRIDYEVVFVGKLERLKVVDKYF